MLELTASSFEKIIEHANAELPREACGVVAGSARKKRITEVFCTTNIDKNPASAYTIDPRELIDVINTIERSAGLELVGFYHTHPFSSSAASEIDRNRATWDEFFYLIYSLIDEDIKCWKWLEKNNQFVEEDIRIV